MKSTNCIRNFFERALEMTWEEPGASIVQRSVHGVATRWTVTQTSYGKATNHRIQNPLSGAKFHKSSFTESYESNGGIRITGKGKQEILFGGRETVEREKFNTRMKLTVV